MGDEHLTYWRTADGACYRQTPSAGVFSKVELSALQSEYDAVVAQKAAREKAILESARTSMPVKKVEGSKFQGKKKCLVILANFADTKFKPEHTLDLYKQIINGENYLTRRSDSRVACVTTSRLRVADSSRSTSTW